MRVGGSEKAGGLERLISAPISCPSPHTRRGQCGTTVSESQGGRGAAVAAFDAPRPPPRKPPAALPPARAGCAPLPPDAGLCSAGTLPVAQPLPSPPPNPAKYRSKIPARYSCWNHLSSLLTPFLTREKIRPLSRTRRKSNARDRGVDSGPVYIAPIFCVPWSGINE